MDVKKEVYCARYRALGKMLEVERLRQSEMMNEDAHLPRDRHRLAQKGFRDKSKDILNELNELEDMLF
jgi:hypothetical protein